MGMVEMMLVVVMMMTSGYGRDDAGCGDDDDQWVW